MVLVQYHLVPNSRPAPVSRVFVMTMYPRITASVRVMQGRRGTQEDRHIILEDFLGYMKGNGLEVSDAAAQVLQHGKFDALQGFFSM